MDANLYLDLMGGYRATVGRDGPPIDFPTKKSALLLVPIIIDQPAPSRDRLASLLWSNRQEQQGRGSLRQAIFTLRATLRAAGAPEPISRQDRMSMPSGSVQCDVLAFRAAAQGTNIEDLEEARRLYKGPFLGTVRLPDPEFTAWAENIRQDLLRMAEAVGVDLSILHKEAGNLPAAIDALDWVLTLDPIREDVHRSLMRLHMTAGNRTLALRQYRNCVTILDRELGVLPDFETQSLHDAIADGTYVEQQPKRPPSVQETVTTAAPSTPSATPMRRGEEPGRKMFPMVAILPFSLLSDEDDLAQLSEGLFEDLTSDLPKFHQVRGKTRNAALSALDSGTPRNEVGMRMGADYVVDGSIRKAGGRIRVNAQLVEVENGVQVWSDRYTLDLDDIFEIQDVLTQRIIVAVTNQLKQEMLAKALRKTEAETTPYDYWLRGFSLLLTGTTENTSVAKTYFEKALVLDPLYARGHCGLSLAHFNEWGAHSWPDWTTAIETAYAHAEEAVRLAETDHVGQTLLGRIHVYRREYDRGQRYLERAFTLNPYGTDMLATAALSWSFLGDHEQAQTIAKRAIDLHPSPPDWYYGGMALSLFMTGKRAEAHKIREKSPKAYLDTLAFIAAGHALEGDTDLARTFASRFHEDFSDRILAGRAPEEGEAMRWIRHANPFRLERDAKLMEDAMTAAGIGKLS